MFSSLKFSYQHFLNIKHNFELLKIFFWFGVCVGSLIAAVIKCVFWRGKSSTGYRIVLFESPSFSLYVIVTDIIHKVLFIKSNKIIFSERHWQKNIRYSIFIWLTYFIIRFFPCLVKVDPSFLSILVEHAPLYLVNIFIDRIIPETGRLLRMMCHDYFCDIQCAWANLILFTR